MLNRFFHCALLHAIWSIGIVGAENNDLAKQIPLANLEGEPNSIVHRCVNAITGDYLESHTDLIMPGSRHPLTIERFYASSVDEGFNIDKGWMLNHSGFLYAESLYSVYKATMRDEYGSTLIFTPRKKGKEHDPYEIAEHYFSEGLTNCAKGLISGRTNHKNTKLWLSKKNDGSFTATNGAGDRYEFDHKNRDYQGLEVRRLTRIKKPSGIKYAYEYDKHDLLKISVENEKDTHVTFNRPKCSKGNKFLELTASDGRIINYIWQKKQKSQYQFEVSSNFFPTQTYHYENHKITKKSLPEDRVRRIEYYDGEDYKRSKKKGKTIDPYILGRVKLIKEPVGCDETLIPTQKFFYDFVLYKSKHPNHSSGKTTVLNALDHKTVYCYDDLCLTAIERYKEGSQGLYSRERLHWGKDPGVNLSNLVNRSLEDSNGNIHFCRHFEYDEFGNIRYNRLYGNLSGQNAQPLELDSKGIPNNNGCESYSVKYSYSKDGLNLMTEEKNDKHRITYEYKKGTDLLTKKLIHSGGIRLRHFYDYDDRGNLLCEIVDNGCKEEKESLEGVTERKIKTIKITKSSPAGLPETIKEEYLDPITKQTKLLHKIKNVFDLQGRLKEQKHYDSAGAHIYTLEWDYDFMGNVKRQKNASGQITTRDYDKNGNLIKEQGPCLDYYTEYDYDFANRLISKKIVIPKGKESATDQVFAETYSYDLMGNKKISRDMYFNEMHYEYDEFGRCIEMTHPPCINENGEIKSVKVSKDYDLMGHEIFSRTDQNLPTGTTYNLYGKPVTICYPDGTKEENVYELNGNLKKAVAKNGSYTLFTYDYLSRPEKKETFAPNGELLYSTLSKYDAFHLIEETDPMGVVTTYAYDGAGRLSRLTKGNQKTEYEYDTWGRKTVTREWADELHYVEKIQAFDNLNRVKEEYTKIDAGAIFDHFEYDYDLDGNRSVVIQFTGKGPAHTNTKYNALGQPVEVIDPLGHKTVIKYSYDYHNAHRQNVPYEESTDLLGNLTVTIKNARGLVVHQARKNPFGQLVQLQESTYNNEGQRTRLLQAIITPGAADQQVITCWSYDDAGKIKELIEAAETPKQKRTTYVYNTVGQLASIIKPDQTEILHQYDALGRLEHHYSKDGSIDYFYHYDRNNHPLLIEDRVHGIETTKKYDTAGMLENETLANGLSLGYTYDALGHPLTITLPDESQVAYSYDPCHLKCVERRNSQGELLYHHTYSDYDLLGKPAAAQMIGQAGRLSWTYDQLGRMASLISPHYSETIEEYDPLGNLLKKSIQIENHTTTCQYTFDALYQLQSETGWEAHEYINDSLYNRVSKDGQPHEVNLLNQLEKDGEGSYIYDDNGRLREQRIGLRKTIFDYDAWDRLIAVTEDDKCTTYLYDAENRRLNTKQWLYNGQEWTLQGTTRFIYQGQNEVGTCDKQGRILELRVLGAGQRAEIGAAIAIEIEGHPYAPIHDHNGNVMSLIDSVTGESAAIYRYTAFGEELDEDVLRNPWRFSSKRMDPETGFLFFGRRYYDPVRGRWTTPDPLGFDGGPNLYAYVLNSPLTRIDLYGLFPSETQPEEMLPHGFWENVSHYVGSAIRMIGDHMLPVPGVRDLVSYAGHRMMAGATHENFCPICRNSGSENFHLCKPEVFPGHIVSFGNGINTTKQEMFTIAGKISEYHGNTNVHFSYNSSHGVIFDLLECLVQKLGIRTRSVETMVEHLRCCIARAGGAGSGGTVDHYAHSQGGLITKCALSLLTPEERQMIHVVTFGSASMISSDFCGSANNYVNTHDFVPFIADIFGCFQGYFARSSHHVNFMSSPILSFGDHGILDSPNYMQMLQDKGNKFVERYGRQR